MKLILAAILAGLLAGCASTPEWDRAAWRAHGDYHGGGMMGGGE